MPIASGENGQTMSMKKYNVTIEHRYDLVPVGYGKAAAGKKIVLYIHENQGIASRKLDLHEPVIIHKSWCSFGPVIQSGKRLISRAFIQLASEYETERPVLAIPYSASPSEM